MHTAVKMDDNGAYSTLDTLNPSAESALRPFQTLCLAVYLGGVSNTHRTI